MTGTPLAEAYEKLKELRRQGDSRSDDMRSVLRTVRDMVAIATDERAEGLIRAIEIKTLAERVFGDAAKADAWLSRPNSSLSGQRPLEMLSDELGAAVVREMLERIDHGIFA
ncbi:antitoxin Xre/MbcA/ParS toxin-binding domain-containing protein [Bradyrhizobium sp.]|uniref:antitoxin Xre/MbcA/ParS toxin-binding domain-containing protein n=1 Tax=Bradyrhizobium sp. TaxID=376 RepID=UPI0040384093